MNRYKGYARLTRDNTSSELAACLERPKNIVDILRDAAASALDFNRRLGTAAPCVSGFSRIGQPSAPGGVDENDALGRPCWLRKHGRNELDGPYPAIERETHKHIVQQRGGYRDRLGGLGADERSPAGTP